jgi:hypothetical protein
MNFIPESSRFERALAWVPFVLSAALVASAVDLAIRRPLVGVVLVQVALVLLVPHFLRRRKLRRVLRSGDADAVLSAWESSLDRVPHPETMAPLIAATALAAQGLAERARRSLARARRGPAWEAAIEQRLVVDTLLSVFEGDPERALETSAALERLPPPASPFLRGRVVSLREAMVAFARAFAHRAAPRDLEVLKAAARRNPLVFWAFSYAAAVVSVDSGRPGDARSLVADAPRWPRESAFSAFHEEIQQLGSRDITAPRDG